MFAEADRLGRLEEEEEEEDELAVDKGSAEEFGDEDLLPLDSGSGGVGEFFIGMAGIAQ